MKNLFLIFILLTAIPTHSVFSQTSQYEKIKGIVASIIQQSYNPNLDIVVKSDSLRTSNAKADLVNNIRWIFYNPQFVQEFEKKANSPYALHALFAHEIGHHVLGHSFSEKNCERVKLMELEADEFAGRILKFPFCATLEETVAGYLNMNKSLLEGCYPPASAREIAITKGWKTRDEVLKTNGQDPCNNISFRLNANEEQKYQKYNKASNPRTTIKGDIMQIEYELPFDSKDSSYVVRLIKSKSAPFAPKSLAWVTGFDKPGTGRLIWEYKKDGYTLDQIKNKSDWFGIGAYTPRFAPELFPNPALFKCITCDLAALGLFIGGKVLNDKAWDKYNTYSTNTDPLNAAIYNPPSTQTRDNLRKQAIKERDISYLMFAVGVGLSYYCTRTILIRSKKDRRYRALELVGQ